MATLNPCVPSIDKMAASTSEQESLPLLMDVEEPSSQDGRPESHEQGSESDSVANSGEMITNTHSLYLRTNPRMKSKCSYCKKKLPDGMPLQSHMIIHTGQNYSSCATCVYGFNEPVELLDHLATHVIVPALLFSTEVGNVNSLLKVDIDQTVTNDPDPNQPPDKSARTDVNEGGKTHKCSECDKEYDRPQDLERHLRSHTGEKPFTCSLCSNAYSRRSTLNRHLRKTHNEVVKKVQGTDTRSQKLLLRTYRANIHICPKCDEEFTDASKLEMHLVIHESEKPQSTSESEESLKKKDNLKSQLLAQSIYEGKPHRCKDCNQYFKNSSTLEAHMVFHTRKPAHECTLCIKKFHQVAKLKKHMRTHTGKKKPHVCSECGKGFSHPYDIKRHMMIHTGEKPFKCAVCDKSFREKGTLNQHLVIHTGEKPHKCSECGKAFGYYRPLRNHIKTHHGGIDC